MIVVWLYLMAKSDRINEDWGERFVNRQTIFDKNRTLLPIIREMERVKKMASDPYIIAMARNESDQKVFNDGIRKLEEYRQIFEDRSYFAAFAKTGHYYFNDKFQKYNPNLPQYTLSQSNKNDAWFFTTMSSVDEIGVNIDKDDILGITKIWLNCLVKENGKVIGVVGTGFDFDQFVKESVAIEQEGIENYFIDKHLAIQLAKDTRIIDYASITKNDGEHITLKSLFSNSSDIESVREAMKHVLKHQDSNDVKTLWVEFKGKKQLLGITYLRELGWFNLTFIDSKELVVVDFMNIAIVFSLLFLIALFLLNTILNTILIRPVDELQKIMERIEKGEYYIDLPIIGTGEIANLSWRFRRMIEYIRKNNSELENKIEQRTQEIRQLAFYDPLTDLPNRRLLDDRLSQAMAFSKRTEQYGAVMFLDLDNFKPLNDQYGHDVGDLLLIEVAQRLRSCMREIDTVARFGGDEFVILLSDLNTIKEQASRDAMQFAEKIRDVIDETYVLNIDGETIEHHCTVSIGMSLFQNHEQAKEKILQQADQAMYEAKEAGRNQIKVI